LLKNSRQDRSLTFLDHVNTFIVSTTSAIENLVVVGQGHSDRQTASSTQTPRLYALASSSTAGSYRVSSTYIGFITPTSTCSSQMPNTICHPRYKPPQGTHRWCLELLAPSHQFELPPNYHSVPLNSRHQILSQHEAHNCACCASVSGSQYPRPQSYRQMMLEGSQYPLSR
jgi:hypothetical protein